MVPENILETFIDKQGREIVFRYPQASDAQVLCDYINAISQEKTFTSFQGEEITLEDEEKFIEFSLNHINEKKGLLILAFHGDILVAVADIRAGIRIEKHIGTFGITVAKDYRESGIGKKMMELVLEKTYEYLPEIAIVVLSVFGSNQRAQNLYKNLGFIEYGNLPQSINHHGIWVDHLYLYKRIR